VSADIIPFARTHAEAWDAYDALNKEAVAHPHLMRDPEHVERRQNAHRLFLRLYRQACAAATVTPLRSA
jgi:hypothetical protein